MSQFRDNAAESRYEWDEQGVVSWCDYAERGGARLLTHVETPAHARGRGYAAHLMAAIVEHAREQRIALQPLCSYAVAYLRRHPVTDIGP